jgi:prepilin-type N-terminal cleavage/methylation domain-containing protein
MLTKVLNKTTRNSRKAGFTIVELMVVIIVINLLSGVALPQLTDYIEKTRQKIDLMKLYHLRDALNRALYEGDVHDIDESATCSNRKTNKDSLSKWLATDNGVTLFIMEMHDVLPTNYQADNKNRIKDDTQNMCGLLTGGGFWASALKDAGFGAIADILYARDHNGNNIKSTSTFTAYKVKINNQDWWRTFPTQPLFISRAINGDPDAAKTGDGGQNRYNFKVRWTGGKEKSHSLDVFIQSVRGTNKGKPFTTRLGTCFSTETALCY